MGLNNAIGIENKLLWKLPNDMQRFKALTINNVVIMGRKTFESFGGKPLKDRVNIVISRNPKYQVPEGVVLTESLPQAVLNAHSYDLPIFIIGGAEIYKLTLAMDYADVMELTIVDDKPEADTYFPPFPHGKWQVEREVVNEPDEKHKFKYTYRTLIRRKLV